MKKISLAIAFIVVGMLLSLGASMVLAELGSNSYAKEDYKSAYRYLSLAVFLNSFIPGHENLGYRNAKALSLMSLDREEEAIEILQSSLEENPDQPNMCYYLGECYEAIDDSDSALEWFRKAQILNPALVLPYDGILRRTLDLDDIQATEALMVEARKNLNNEQQARLYSAIYHYQFSKESFEEAEESIMQSVVLFPEEWLHWWNLSTVRLATEDYDGALESMEKVIELDPENERAKEISLSLKEAIHRTH